MTIDKAMGLMSKYKDTDVCNVKVIKELIIAIFENKSCDGCTYHLSANGNIPLSCCECSRFYADKFEEKK